MAGKSQCTSNGVSVPAGSRKGHARAGQPGRVGLTREEILRSAIALIDEKGLAKFSLRDLARSLGVYPATIYWHVGGSRDQLFAEVAAAITTQVMPSGASNDDWRDVIRSFFHSYRAAVAAHPNVASLLGAQMRSNGVPHAPMVETVLTALRLGRFDGEALVHAYNAVIGGLAGFVTMEFGPASLENEDKWGASMSAQLDDLDPVRYPTTSSMLPQMRNQSFVLRWQNGSVVPLDGGFTYLVEGLILGLEALRTGPHVPICSIASMKQAPSQASQEDA